MEQEDPPVKDFPPVVDLGAVPVTPHDKPSQQDGLGVTKDDSSTGRGWSVTTGLLNPQPGIVWTREYCVDSIRRDLVRACLVGFCIDMACFVAKRASLV